jgi:hypothetical protein
MQEAVAAALADGASDDTEDDEGTVEGTEATETEDETGAENEQDSTEEATGEESEGEAEASADVTEDDVPTVYFGEDLSAFDAKTRAAIIEIVKPRDQHIQTLLREKATEAKAEDAGDEAAPKDEAPAATTDEELLAELGLSDVSDPDDPTTKALLTVTRFALGLKDEVTELRTKGELSDTKTYWETSLASLEKQYGVLPASHEEVMREAAKAGVAEPMAAYWLIMGPGRQQLMAEVTKRRDEAAKQLKGKQKPTKPRTSQNTEDVPIEADNVGDALKIALGQMGKERGWSLYGDDD